jgi:hypothetical protein
MTEHRRLEPAAGFEPTACRLRNALSQFKGVRSYPPTTENSILAMMSVRLHPDAIVRIGVAIDIVLGRRWAQNSGDNAI